MRVALISWDRQYGGGRGAPAQHGTHFTGRIAPFTEPS